MIFYIRINEIVKLKTNCDILSLERMKNKPLIMFVVPYCIDNKIVNDRYVFYIFNLLNNDVSGYFIDYGTFRIKNQRMIIEASNIILKIILR